MNYNSLFVRCRIIQVAHMPQKGSSETWICQFVILIHLIVIAFDCVFVVHLILTPFDLPINYSIDFIELKNTFNCVTRGTTKQHLTHYTHTVFDVIETVLKAKDWKKAKPRICADQLCSELIQNVVKPMQRVSVGSEFRQGIISARLNFAIRQENNCFFGKLNVKLVIDSFCC